MATRKSARASMPDPLTPTPPPAPVQQELAPPAGEKPARLVQVYAKIEEGLALMREKHGGVLTAAPIVTSENVETVRANLREMVKFRTTLEATRKAEKEESLRYGQKVDAEAKRIQAVADPIEAVYKKAIESYEFAEQERKDAILRRIAELRATPQQAIGKTVDQLEAILEGINTFPLAELQEFREQGASAQVQAAISVRQLLAQAREAEQAREEAEAAAREADRIRLIRTRIEAMHAAATQCRRASKADTLERLIAIFKEANPRAKPATDFDDLLQEACQVFDGELAALEQLLADKRKGEADAKRLVEMEQELQRLRALAATPAPTAAPTPAPEVERMPVAQAMGEIREAVDRGASITSVELQDQGNGTTRVRVGVEAPDKAALTHEARRWCHGDDAWTDWQACTAETAHRRSLDSTFEVRLRAVDDEPAQPGGEPEAIERLPREGGLFRVTGLGQDSSGAMHAEFSPAQAGEAGVVRVTPDPEGPGVIVEGMSIQTDVGLMPAPPDADEVVQHLADHYDDHPFNIVQMLASFDYATLAEKFRG
jgi:negative regulator of replication initiation